MNMLVAQSCPPLCDPMDCSLPGFSDHGILQTRTLEWVAMPFSREVPDKVGLNLQLAMIQSVMVEYYILFSPVLLKRRHTKETLPFKFWFCHLLALCIGKITWFELQFSHL